MLETKINLIISSFTAILFSIIGFYYIFNDIIKNIKRNKIIKIKERKKMEGSDCNVREMIPPSIFEIGYLTIDLDSVIALSFKSGKYIQFITATDGCNYTISINDLKFIENTEELESNSEYKVISDKFSHSYYDIPSSDTKFSKYEEIEKLYNQILKWKEHEWKTLTGKDVKNQDLWLKIIKIKDKYQNLKFNWVKGHDNDKYNIECDAMCQAKIREGVAEVQNA